MKTITLINPRDHKDIARKEITPLLPPLNLLYLGTFLVMRGVDVSIWDENINGYYDPSSEADILGIGLYSKNDILALDRISAQIDVPIVVGGPAASRELSKTYRDVAVVCGAGYFPLVSLVNKFQSGFYDGGTRQLELPLLFERFSAYKYTSACLMTQFGCRYSCKFCLAPMLSQYRKRPLANVLYELRQLKSLSIKYFEFFDNDLFMNRDWKYIVSSIPNNLPWGCVTSIRNIQDRADDFKLAVDNGMYTCGIGLESDSMTTLTSINKQVRPRDIRATFDILPKLCELTRPYVFLMYGLPSQTAEAFWGCYNRLREMDVPVKASRLLLVPGTPLRDDGYGYTLNDMGSVLESPWMSSEELNEIETRVEQDRLSVDKYLYGELYECI